jgi:hypothetical protein
VGETCALWLLSVLERLQRVADLRRKLKHSFTAIGVWEIWNGSG